MSAAIDSSVVIAALNEADLAHEASRCILVAGGHFIHTHAFTETFSVLTGGRLGIRLPAEQIAGILKEYVFPLLRPIALTADDLLDAYIQSESRGIRGGAIYDYLHLFATRKSSADQFYTLNISDFQAFHRPGDPEILYP